MGGRGRRRATSLLALFAIRVTSRVCRDKRGRKEEGKEEEGRGRKGYKVASNRVTPNPEPDKKHENHHC